MGSFRAFSPTMHHTNKIRGLDGFKAVVTSIRGTLRSITDLHLITQAAGAPEAPPQPPTQPNLVAPQFISSEMPIHTTLLCSDPPHLLSISHKQLTICLSVPLAFFDIPMKYLWEQGNMGNTR